MNENPEALSLVTLIAQVHIAMNAFGWSATTLLVQSDPRPRRIDGQYQHEIMPSLLARVDTRRIPHADYGTYAELFGTVDPIANHSPHRTYEWLRNNAVWDYGVLHELMTVHAQEFATAFLPVMQEHVIFTSALRDMFEKRPFMFAHRGAPARPVQWSYVLEVIVANTSMNAVEAGDWCYHKLMFHPTLNLPGGYYVTTVP